MWMGFFQPTLRSNSFDDLVNYGATERQLALEFRTTKRDCHPMPKRDSPEADVTYWEPSPACWREEPGYPRWENPDILVTAHTGLRVGGKTRNPDVGVSGPGYPGSWTGARVVADSLGVGPVGA